MQPPKEMRNSFRRLYRASSTEPRVEGLESPNKDGRSFESSSLRVFKSSSLRVLVGGQRGADQSASGRVFPETDEWWRCSPKDGEQTIRRIQSVKRTSRVVGRGFWGRRRLVVGGWSSTGERKAGVEERMKDEEKNEVNFDSGPKLHRPRLSSPATCTTYPGVVPMGLA
jgi:hypothetical protein